eukprot:gene37168-42097_t
MNTVHLGLKLFQIELEDLLNVVANTSPEKLAAKTTKAFMMQAKQKDVDLQLVGDYWITNDDGELELLSQYEAVHVPDGLPEATVVVPADQQGLLQD